jgi:hypothetical protein
LRSSRQLSATGIADDLEICGVKLPDYQGKSYLGGETYGVRFPDSLFDSAALPRLTLDSTLSALAPGATYQSQEVAVLLGAMMGDPIAGQWPASTDLSATAQDGHPGVELDLVTDSGYSSLPVSPFGGDRADQLYMALRQVVSVSGTLDSCTSMSGAVTTFAINSHILGCHLESGGACDASETDLLDGAQPVFTAGAGATVTMTKIPDTTDCTGVRAM